MMMRSPTAAMAAVAALVGGGALLAMTGQSGTPVPASAPVETIDTSRMTQSFVDEFDGSALDPRKWSLGERGDRLDQRTMSGNNERQVYADPGFLDLGIQPARVANGALTLSARPLTAVERTVVRAAADALPAANRSPAYQQLGFASGRATTRGKFAQKYGYFEVRARFSPGKGLWPALWLLPEDGGWPPEIDIMEALGQDLSQMVSTVHSSAAPKQDVVVKLSPGGDQYHRYGILWGPQTIDVYVDGEKKGSMKTPADAHKPMYLIANLAVGGNWPGDPDAQTRFPATLDIDYVRAWKWPEAGKR